MKKYFIILVLAFLVVGWTQKWYLACVIDKKENHSGVVVTRDIIDSKTKKVWVILETIHGTKSSFVENLEECACSSLPLNDYPNFDYVKFLAEEAQAYLGLR